MDNRFISVIRTINEVNIAKLVRAELGSFTQETQAYLEPRGRLQQNRKAEHPRILVCGPSTLGKSTLINQILEKDVVSDIQIADYRN